MTPGMGNLYEILRRNYKTVENLTNLNAESEN
jgi:hypothetical protein